ncbi:MAG: hypothetical protein E6242_08005, partial [Staphylococcus epidermidis]|nr:hypothetical protein [Staphylococcus epidermidis]
KEFIYFCCVAKPLQQVVESVCKGSSTKSFSTGVSHKEKVLCPLHKRSDLLKAPSLMVRVSVPTLKNKSF